MNKSRDLCPLLFFSYKSRDKFLPSENCLDPRSPTCKIRDYQNTHRLPRFVCCLFFRMIIYIRFYKVYVVEAITLYERESFKLVLLTLYKNHHQRMIDI